ncbi:MAG: acyloxyacyl hydrolase [Candidatus Levyibacteriota bacterium]
MLQATALAQTGANPAAPAGEGLPAGTAVRVLQFGIVCALLAASRCFAANVALSGGMNHETVIVGVATQWMAASPLHEGATWALHYGAEFDLLNMHARQARKYGASNIAAVGATPLLRVDWPRGDHVNFVDVGVGGHLLSHTSLQGGPNFGSAFQFGEWIGAGIRFGRGEAHELGLRLEHLSNADIKRPNDGITFVALRAAWRF